MFMDYEFTSNSRAAGVEENTNHRPFSSLSSLINTDTDLRKAAKIPQSKSETAPHTASQNELPPLLRANDVARQQIANDAFLFDEFWREGEIALLFGGESSGKSILAMQIADSVAKGRGIGCLKMTAKRQKVLYVDLNTSERQFASRYGSTKLSANLFHYRPDSETNLSAMIERYVESEGIRTIIVDSIEEMKRTLYGVRETLSFMRQMRVLSRRHNVSILVLATDHLTRDRDVTPDAIAEYRLLCSAADGVSCIGNLTDKPATRFLLQLRTRAEKIVWGFQDSPEFTIERDGKDMPRAVFDERFSPEIDHVLKETLTEIARLRRDGVPYRDIARCVGLSKTRVHELHRRWGAISTRWFGDDPEQVAERAEVYDKHFSYRDHQEDLARYGFDPDAMENDLVMEPQIEDDPINGAYGVWHFDESGLDDLRETRAFRPPFAAALGRRSILDMEHSEDQNGNKIYVDEWLPNNKPLVWYRRYKGKHFRRFTRSHTAVIIDDIRNGPFLERTGWSASALDRYDESWKYG